MTNTLHRFGAPKSFRDDYIIFAMAARGINDADAPEKLQDFLRMALKHHPINVANSRKGGIFRPSKKLTPLVHWRRRESVNPTQVMEEIDACTTAAAVFDDPKRLEAFLADLRQADLGLSINISALSDEARSCCQRVGITRHSVGYSLGFYGDLSCLPDRRVLEISTMCGHGMVSHNFVRKMIDWVKEGRRDPGQAATYMAKFCSCGIFNPTRATRILEEARRSN